ncbi:phosphoglucomutase/phosphomannomutase [Legionella wadsworthii]|uniref:Phosphoglucosamine mutase n=1 Tax=Legionella wadsworthii TaxID=28088 RepID=A0A378LWK2_9GAMM|nr:phosphoglucosamine mutase [Legionella wadsworthii]STY30376.1 phosphoglucomutase/phosphomannomutase [Legionella wadsworthii]
MKSSKKYFGTDGIRARVGEFPITIEFLPKLGWAIGRVLGAEPGAKVVIGKDTRISGYMIESALQAGLLAAGTRVFLLGPIPTSAIAYFTRTLRANVGIVISASHNSYEDNGLKFFSKEGYKLSDEIENKIENQLDRPIDNILSKNLGKAQRVHDAAGRYIEFCKSSVPHHTSFKNIKVVVDCANGATYHIAPNVFMELDANVIPINTTPNGMNINLHCGSIYPEAVRYAVLHNNADIGIAFDGDGDRVIMVDDKGEILDGDDILYILVKELLHRKKAFGGVVGTYMSNVGLEIALGDLQVPFTRVPVGDQNIIHALREKKWELGGEPSGHIIYLGTNTTGDGIIAALQVLQFMLITGKSLHELKQGLKKYPQKVVKIPYTKKIDLNHADIEKAKEENEQKLGVNGRVLIRYSGTERVIRLMVEGENLGIVEEVILTLREVIAGLVRI